MNITAEIGKNKAGAHETVQTVEKSGAGGPSGQPPGSPPPVAQPPRRPREMQDPLNLYLYHPLAARLARALVPTPVTPNMVSVAGGLLVVAAGLVYWGMAPRGLPSWGLAWPLAPLLGMALHMGWHVVDGADGDLARLTGKASPVGEIVDGICDYVSHIIVYFLLGFTLHRTLGDLAYWWMWAAGISHIVQSNHVEVERRFYYAWIYGVPWLHHAQGPKGGDAPAVPMLRGLLAPFRPFVAGYMALAGGLTPRAGPIDIAVTAAQDNPEKLARIRAIISARRRPLLPLLKVMGPNPRAIVLGLGMVAGSPLWFFAYQALVLNALLALSLALHNRAARRIESELAAAGLL